MHRACVCCVRITVVEERATRTWDSYQSEMKWIENEMAEYITAGSVRVIDVNEMYL